MPRIFFAVIVCVFVASFTYTAKTSTTPYKLAITNPELPYPNISKDNPLTEEGVRLGRLLFYDKILSGNNLQSCGSCHKQELAFSDGYQTAIGAKGDTNARNTMALINLAWQEQFFWDGRAKTLEELVRSPVTNAKEMGQDTTLLVAELKQHAYYPLLFERAFPNDSISMVTVSKAIAQFLRTITSNGLYFSDSVFPVALVKQYPQAGDSLLKLWGKEKTLRGSFIRFSEMCSGCHKGIAYAGTEMATNLVDSGIRMKIPSLLNITLTKPYMHDGRFNTLNEVITHYQTHIALLHVYNKSIHLQSINNLFNEYDSVHANSFFELLTDSTIITRKDLSDPFAEPGFSWLK